MQLHHVKFGGHQSSNPGVYVSYLCTFVSVLGENPNLIRRADISKHIGELKCRWTN